MTETGLSLAVERPERTDSAPRLWLMCFIALVAILVLANLVTDSSADMNYGWDVRVNCAAVDAHTEGRDPYFVKNLKGTKLSYPYLPVTLDVFRPLCAGGVLAGHHRGVYLLLAVLCGLLLPGLGTSRPNLRDVFLKTLCVLGAFVGFEWTLASGNFTIFSGALTALALALLLGRAGGEGRTSFLSCLTGAALLGLLTSFKLVFFPVLASLYFLPQPRHRKFILIGVAAGAFALPILLSLALYGDLFRSWLSAISGQIPDQHAVALNETNPSLLLLMFGVAETFGLGGSKPVAFAAYGLAATALILAPFALSVLRVVGGPARSGPSWLPARLDRWLIDHPREAARITVLAMYALYLCSPRLKEYAFFELAVYAAVLMVDLPPMALAGALGATVLFPTLASMSGSVIEGSYIQLVAGLVGFWILLADFCRRRSL
jgi:hypothetical protein